MEYRTKKILVYIYTAYVLVSCVIAFPFMLIKLFKIENPIILMMIVILATVVIVLMNQAERLKSEIEQERREFEESLTRTQMDPLEILQKHTPPEPSSETAEDIKIKGEAKELLEKIYGRETDQDKSNIE